MNPLGTRYLGFELKNPIVASASPLSQSLAGIRRIEDAGAAAVVIYSLFEEQIVRESRNLDKVLSNGSDVSAEAQSCFPELSHYNVGPEEYLNLISIAREAVKIPIIGSLNGVSTGGWTRYARSIEEAGADALELNIYYLPTDPHITGTEIEKLYVDVVRDVKSKITIPLAVKVSPYFSATANMAFRLAQAGADGLVLFNRFYQPDIQIANLEVVPRVHFSTSHELLLPLHWVGLLYGRVSADFAVTSGVHTHEDVLKAMMAGANCVMMASELLQSGLGRIKEILADIEAWMEEYEYQSITQMRGSMSQRNVTNPSAYERANYMKVLDSV
jgi:dihydroorotate dehydrogenase (fumarate)